jgi:hypothetical protein
VIVMSESASAPAPPTGATAAEVRPRKGPPFWVGLAFVLLLGGGYVVTQLITYTGPKIEWRTDYTSALAEARSTGKRVFLLLQEPNCPVTAANERELFSTRFARERLANMIPCRVILKPNDPLREQFEVSEPPVMLNLEPSGIPIGRAQGRMGEAELRTYFNPK